MALLLAVEPWEVLGEKWLVLGWYANLQMGVATVTCIAICGAGTTELLVLGMKPES